MAHRTRFAPSPTGELHLGHAYAALVAQAQGDDCLLRFEDIDYTRVREAYYHQIEEDLTWIGFSWSGTPVRQLERMALYEEALDTLKSLKVVYPCFCTRKDLQVIDAPQGPEGTLYPGTCRELSNPNFSLPHCWRLDSQKAESLTGGLTFFDKKWGILGVNGTLLGDVILARKDITTSYHIAVVIDDDAQGIDLVTRGADLLNSTHIHRLLQSLLGLEEPSYLHHELIVDDSGQRLAKRDAARSLRSLREAGLSRTEVIQLLPQHIIHPFR